MTKEIKTDLMCKGFHSGAISAIDIAVQRPIIVTASRDDSTIRVWNYYTYTCELAREYYVLDDMTIKEAAKPLISVAIHPSGYYVAASFINKIQIYHILHDSMRHFKNVEVKSANRMKFSVGGHLFFAADNKSISVFNAYNLQRLHVLKINPVGLTEI